MPNSETNAPSEDDLAYTAYVRASIERGLADCAAGRVIDVENLRAKYGLPALSAMMPLHEVISHEDVRKQFGL